MTRLSLSLFGAFQATLDGRPVTGFESNKVRALLAYLAVEAHRAHSRDSLAGLLWPEFPDRTALNNLRYALSDLRKVIGDREAEPPFLLIDNHTLQFNTASHCSFDVGDFVQDVESRQIERLKEAVARYQGPFLDGFNLTDSIAFEEWMTLKRQQYGRLMLRALRQLTDYHERHGEYDEAQHYARQQIELEPWQEEAHRQLIRAMAFNNQRSAALAHYEMCCRMLEEELAVDPAPETTALYESIRDGTLTIPPIAAPPPPFLEPDAPTIYVERQPFVGFDAELARLDGFIRRMLGGQGQVVFVTGDPGQGKTMLVQEFTRRALAAHSDLIVVNGNCNAYTGVGDPYLPFLEMLEMLTGDVEARWAIGDITLDHARRLWMLLPVVVQALVEDGPEIIDRFVSGNGLLARALTGAPSQAARLEELLNASSGGGGQQANLFEQYTKVLCRLARHHPLLLVIDDLQWADTGSLSLLFHLAKRISGQCIVLIGAYRPEDVALGRNGERHPLEPVVNELKRDYGDCHVDLSRVDGSLWIDALLDTQPNGLDQAFRETLYRHTGGHPLFTVELLRGLQQRGDLFQDDDRKWMAGPVLDWETLPPRVEAVIAETVSRLPESLREMLTVASVEGEFFTAQTVAYVQDLDDQEVMRSLSGPLSKQYRFVAAAGIERVDGRHVSHYRFRHFLFQKYLYSRLDDTERAYLHEEMGEALEMLYEGQLPDIALQLARHFEAAGLIAQAVNYLHQVADRAVRLYANIEAIAHYRHALDLLTTLPDTPQRNTEELRLRAALRIPLETMQGYTSAELAQNNARARELTRDAEPSPELFWVLTGLATYDNLRLSLREAHELGDEMLALAEHLDEPVLRLAAYQVSSINALYEGRLETYFNFRKRAYALYDHEQHPDLAFQFDADVEVARLSHAGWAYWIQGYPDRARQQASVAIAWAEKIGHPFSLGFAFYFASQVHTWCGDIPVVRKLAEETNALAQEHNIAVWVNGTMLLQAWTDVQEGRVAEGVKQFEEHLAITVMMGMEFGRVMDIPMIADAYTCVGRLTDALALLDDGLRVVHESGFAMMESDLYRSKADVLLECGDEVEAEAYFWRAIESARRIEAKSWELRATLGLCRLWQWQGKYEAACELLAPVYGWFTEGFDTQDLQEARLLLGELARE